MKNTSLPIIAAAAIALAISPGVVFAQEITTETRATTISGSVQEFAPDAVTVTTTSASPARYQVSKTTRYVDDEGNPVSVEVVRSGAPVTVYYASSGDQMVASRIVVHKVRRTATEAGSSVSVSESEPVTAVGTVTQSGDGLFTVRSSDDAVPTPYYFSKTTKYVDSDGNPVAVSYVKSGVPVTVQYARIGDRMVASKVIVKRTRVTATVPAAEQSTTTVSEPAPAPAAVVRKKTITTTTTHGDE